MKQYIDKSAVVAEIERLKECNRKICGGDFDFLKKAYPKHYYSTEIYNDILSFLDTLEVKENDLVEEIDYEDYIRFFKEHPEYSNGDWGFEETWAFAQYCYTLGLKAKKGE